MSTFICFILVWFALQSGCMPDFGASASLLDSPRILAVRSEPAEVYPGESVRLMVYATDGGGMIALPPVEWAFCEVPKPPVENNVISERCLSDAVRPIPGQELVVVASVPGDACTLFGPELPPSASGQPALRPRDPDGTGGFYQPVRVRVLGLTAIGLVRIRCGLSGATPAVAARFRMEYLANRNPFATTLAATLNQSMVSLAAIPVGRDVMLHLPLTAQASESFMLFDAKDQSLGIAKERLSVSWFSSLGRFRLASTDAQEQLEFRNEWLAPQQPGSARIWTVLRDDRGGTTVLSHIIRVESQ